MTDKIKITFSLTQTVATALKQQAPRGNVSAFVDSCLRKSLILEPLPKDRVGKLIQHLTIQKEARMGNEYTNGYKMGQDDTLDETYSLEALEILEENLNPGNKTWLDTEDQELNEGFQNAVERVGFNSKEFADGYWRGVLSVWKEIKNKI